MTLLRAIRAKCLECSGGSTSEVRECPISSCSLYPFRIGHNPNINDIGSCKRLVTGKIGALTPKVINKFVECAKERKWKANNN